MGKKQSFKAVIEAAGGGGAFVNVPFDVEKVFGQKRVKVVATIDGEPYRGSIVRMGRPEHMLPLLKEIRQKIGKNIGDEVSVTVEEDVEPRVVTVPDDLKRALGKSKTAAAFFEKLSYTHQREYVKWIESAKREETRTSRVEKALEMLVQGKRER